ncbi:hypothetical protein FTX61_14205 [Nitriliruptoraceae bacterium ZYF776]|nr:hypothetical protein [Profundirhabdus halotolerans]
MTGSRRPLLRVVAWPYALATVAVVVLWSTVGATSLTQWVDLLTFWWSLPAVALVLVALVARDRRAAALFAVPAVLWLWAYGTAFLPGEAPAAVPDLRVVSFNTFVAVEGEEHVLDLVETTEPDVLLLQEVFPPREAALRERLADRFPHVHVDQSPGVGGVAVLSRHPIVDTIPVGTPSERSRTTSVVVLDVDGELVQVVSLHLISPCPTCGTSVVERLELEDDVRRAEVSATLEALDPDLPVVVGGDLNSGERSTAYRQLAAAGFDDPQRRAGSGPGFTWPADRRVPAFLRIDWILTRGLTPVAAWVAPPHASDHRPVVVDVALP